MSGNIFDINDIRLEISFNSSNQLRSILSFCQMHNLYKINIPCKNNLKKDFLLNSIKISREEFPNIDLIPHFSILHEFKRNRLDTLNSFINFIRYVKGLDCSQVLLVSGSQKRSTLDSVTTLSSINDRNLFSKGDFSIGVAFNPYLPSFLFEEEIIKLEKKLKSGVVRSIWIQFGTDFDMLENRMKLLRKKIFSFEKTDLYNSRIKLFGSILIPSKQFLSRFKYRPWKGVYCSDEFLGSVDIASEMVKNLLKIYNKYQICPIIETQVTTEVKLNSLKQILQS